MATEEGTRPEPGDATVCLHCSKLLIFDDELSVREPSPDEEDELMGDERVRAVLAPVMMKGKRMIETTTEFMYEGNNRDNLQKIIDMKFRGNTSIDARMSRLFYMTIFDSLEILGPHVADGKTALEVSEVIVCTIANFMSVLHVNLFPPEVQREIMAMTMMNLVETSQAFLASTLESFDKKKEEEKEAVRN